MTAEIKSTFGFTQPICEDCWQEVHGARKAVRLVGKIAERCYRCSKVTVSGIYIRIDPMTSAYPTLRRDGMVDVVFTVRVVAGSYAQAEQVIRERLAHDEDLGFEYSIDCRIVREPCPVCGEENYEAEHQCEAPEGEEEDEDAGGS